MKSILQALLVIFAALAGTQQANAISADKKIGSLECYVAEGSGMIVGSRKDISCTLFTNADEAVENYIGELTKVGLDIGFTEETVLIWSVYVREFKEYKPGSLAGRYNGASATASLKIGLGASLLIGGLGENFTLQPLKINRQDGINIALGVAQMELRYIKDTETGPEEEEPENPDNAPE